MNIIRYYPKLNSVKSLIVNPISGATGWTRTNNTRIFSPLLSSRLELQWQYLAPLGGVEPHAVRQTLRIGLEDLCLVQGLIS